MPKGRLPLYDLSRRLEKEAERADRLQQRQEARGALSVRHGRAEAVPMMRANTGRYPAHGSRVARPRYIDPGHPCPLQGQSPETDTGTFRRSDPSQRGARS